MTLLFFAAAAITCLPAARSLLALRWERAAFASNTDKNAMNSATGGAIVVALSIAIFGDGNLMTFVSEATSAMCLLFAITLFYQEHPSKIWKLSWFVGLLFHGFTAAILFLALFV